MRRVEHVQEENILTKSYLPGGAALCRREDKSCLIGVAFGVQKLSSRVGESQMLQIEGLRQPRVATWASDICSGGLRSSPGRGFELRGTLPGGFRKSPRLQVDAFLFVSRLQRARFPVWGFADTPGGPPGTWSWWFHMKLPARVCVVATRLLRGVQFT